MLGPSGAMGSIHVRWGCQPLIVEVMVQMQCTMNHFDCLDRVSFPFLLVREKLELVLEHGVLSCAILA
jgi:hypothetical protein